MIRNTKEMNSSMMQPNPEKPIESGATDASFQPSLELTEQERPLAKGDERAPEREPDILDQVKELAGRGEMSAAQVMVRALIAREPGNARARAVLAGLLEKKGDLEGAVAELGRALENAPDDVSVLCARATLLASRARYDQAEVDLRRAVRINPRNPEVQIQLGILFSKRARWREAIEPLMAAVASDSSNADAHYHLGEAYNHIDELLLALASYETASTLQPNSQRALKGIGIVLDRLGRPTEAAAAYRRARETQKR